MRRWSLRGRVLGVEAARGLSSESPTFKWPKPTRATVPQYQPKTGLGYQKSECIRPISSVKNRPARWPLPKLLLAILLPGTCGSSPSPAANQWRIYNNRAARSGTQRHRNTQEEQEEGRKGLIKRLSLPDVIENVVQFQASSRSLLRAVKSQTGAEAKGEKSGGEKNHQKTAIWKAHCSKRCPSHLSAADHGQR